MNAQCSAEAELSGYMEREMLWKMILMQKVLHCVQSREKDNGRKFHKTENCDQNYCGANTLSTKLNVQLLSYISLCSTNYSGVFLEFS